jgi:hypothetical protein
MPDPRVGDDVVGGGPGLTVAPGALDDLGAAALDRTRGLPHRQRECDTQPMLRLDDEWVWDACAADDAEGFLVAR